jgi:hypothetical protein
MWPPAPSLRSLHLQFTAAHGDEFLWLSQYESKFPSFLPPLDKVPTVRTERGHVCEHAVGRTREARGARGGPRQCCLPFHFHLSVPHIICVCV